MKISLIPAKVIAWYFTAYREFIKDNNLADDSNSISVKSLINFIDEELDEYGREQYNLPKDRIKK